MTLVAPTAAVLLKPPSAWTDRELVGLLQDHSYDTVSSITGCSRGRIYGAACRLAARKHEARIEMRKRARDQLQREFLAEIIGTTERMDVLDFLGGIPTNTVDLYCSSPPFNLGKNYGGKGPGADSMRFSYFYGWLVQVLSEMARTLKKGGTLFLDLSNTRDWEGRLYPMDVMLFEDLRRMGLVFKSRVIWVFGHGLTPEDRLAERYQPILVLSKGDDQVFNANAARTPQKEPGKRAFKGPRRGMLSGHPYGAAPTNVWYFPQVGHNHPEKTDHPCQMPLPVARRAILLYSKAGALVGDPFSGSGTTHEGCIRTGRGFVGADLSYEDTRRKRLAKVMPDLVTMLPGVTDASSAIWQAEARRVDVAPVRRPGDDEREQAELVFEE